MSSMSVLGGITTTGVYPCMVKEIKRPLCRIGSLRGLGTCFK